MLPQPSDASLLTLEHWAHPAVITLRSLYRLGIDHSPALLGLQQSPKRAQGDCALWDLVSLRWAERGLKRTCLDRWGESLCWDQPCSPSRAYLNYLYSKSKDVILNMISQGCFLPGTSFLRWAVINTLCSFTEVFGRYKHLGVLSNPLWGRIQGLF